MIEYIQKGKKAWSKIKIQMQTMDFDVRIRSANSEREVPTIWPAKAEFAGVDRRDFFSGENDFCYLKKTKMEQKLDSGISFL